MIGNFKFNNRLLQEFEPQGWIDYVRIPYALLHFWIAYVLWRAEIWRIKHTGRRFTWGRYDDPTPVLCPRCMWSGRRKEMVHDYRSDGAGDVEASDECPRCGLDL